MNKKLIIVVVVAAAIIFYGGKQYYKNQSGSDDGGKQTFQNENGSGTLQRIGDQADGEILNKDSVKTFNVVGDNFSFDIKEIKVTKGDKVKIVFVNKEGFHDWVLDEFNAKTPRLGEGKTAEVEFVASKTGSFEYYCSVGEHRQMGMKGILVVE